MHTAKKYNKIFLATAGVSIFAFFIFIAPPPVFAQVCNPAEKLCILSPLGALSVPALANRILKGLFGIVGTVALLVLLYGGFLWMTSQGSTKTTKLAWDTMTWAALGLALIFGSYIIVHFLLGIFLKETIVPSSPSAPARPPLQDSPALPSSPEAFIGHPVPNVVFRHFDPAPLQGAGEKSRRVFRNNPKPLGIPHPAPFLASLDG